MGDIIHYDPDDAVKSKGYFYEVKYDKVINEIVIKNDIHSFLPIYYVVDKNVILVSSSVDWLSCLLDDKTHNPQFIIDIALFNVPIDSACFLQKIKRVGYGKSITISQFGLFVTPSRRVYDYFVDNPVSYAESIGNIVNVFIEQCSYYVDEHCFISLTGGFDGRTIVSLSHYLGNKYTTYSYGRAHNDDVVIPEMISKKLGLEYLHLPTSDFFAENQYIGSVQASLRYSGGMNSFLYPHAYFVATQLEQLNRPIVTGYCGSELLRNAHSGGAVSSQCAIDLLKGGVQYAITRAMERLNNSVLDSDCRTKYLVPAIESVALYFDKLPNRLSSNQKLAVFEYEEVLPKLFGTWVYISMHFAKTRVPFMDPIFFSELAKTRVSQVYRNFLEQSPIRRFYGQLLYSKIMEKTWPEISELVSGKGYSPADLLSVKGRVKVALGYRIKQKKKKFTNYDNLGLISGMMKYIGKLPIARKAELDSVIDVEELSKNGSKRDMVLLKLSALEYNAILNRKQN